MGENNGGYTLHLNFTEAQFNAFKTMINVGPNSRIKHHVLENMSETAPFEKVDYSDMGDLAWIEINRAKKGSHGN